jgi:hypothetical protein
MRTELKNIAFRGSQANYRRCVPKDIQDRFSGQIGVFIALPAGSRSDIQRLGALLSASFETAIVLARTGVTQRRFGDTALKQARRILETPRSGQQDVGDVGSPTLPCVAHDNINGHKKFAVRIRLNTEALTARNLSAGDIAVAGADGERANDRCGDSAARQAASASRKLPDESAAAYPRDDSVPL